VAALRKLGHDTVMVPLYLPMTLEDEDQSRGLPIFFGGINVYLEEKSPVFAKLPRWLHRWLASPRLLKWAAGSAAKTRPDQLGALTLSMLRGEQGHQVRELDELADWLAGHFRPDVICLSNALLLGMTRRLKEKLRVPVVCLLAGEDSFLDSLPEPYRRLSWETIALRAREVDRFAATSEYYGQVMGQRLKLAPNQMKVVYSGVDLDGFSPSPALPNPPVLGYFARMCREKGLPTLVEAFIQLKQRDRVKDLRLRIGGGLSPTDEMNVVKGVRENLRAHGLLGWVDFCPNLTRGQKLEFYRSLSVLSVPALYGEAFGLYLVEAWASGVPVVQPRHAAFPELIRMTQAGILCEPNDATALAEAVEQLLLDPNLMRAMGQAGRRAAVEQFGIGRMAEASVELFRELTADSVRPGSQDEVSQARPVSATRS
jgi:glycosyltransferase involved in cell wall biosynthesis